MCPIFEWTLAYVWYSGKGEDGSWSGDFNKKKRILGYLVKGNFESKKAVNR